MTSLGEIELLAGIHFDSAVTTSRVACTVRGRRRKETPQRRLALLGDTLLRTILTERFIQDDTGKTVAEIDRHRISLECATHLKKVGEKLGLARVMNMARGQATQIKKSNRILAETVEAIIAAIFLNSGYEAATRFVIRNVMECR